MNQDNFLVTFGTALVAEFGRALDISARRAGLEYQHGRFKGGVRSHLCNPLHVLRGG